MNNVMTIKGHKAVIRFDPEIKMFRGEFTGLAGGADFYADSVGGLYQEGALSLKLYFEACREEGIEPLKTFSGRLTVRLHETTHEAAVLAAKAEQKSLNHWIEEVIQAAAAGNSIKTHKYKTV